MVLADKIEKESFSVNQIVQNKKDVYIIESDCIVPDVKPDIIEIISTNGILNIYKKEVMDGKIVVTGSINTYIDYIGENNGNRGIRCINHSMDFSQIIQLENVNSSMNDECNIVLNNIRAKIINERKVNIKAELGFDISVLDVKKCDFIKNIDLDEIQKRDRIIQTNSLISCGSTKTSINEKQEVDIADIVAEILRVNAIFKDTETKNSVNKVMIKSDLVLEILYVTEDGRINKSRAVYPVMGFIESEGISDNIVVVPFINVSNSIVKINSSQANCFDVDVEVSISASIYENKEINIIDDLYSTKRMLKMEKQKIQSFQNLNIIKGRESFSTKDGLNIENGTIIDIDSKIINKEVNCVDSKIRVKIEVESKTIYLNEKITTSKNVNTIEFDINNQSVNSNTISNISLNIINENYTVMSGGNVEIRFDVEYIAKIRNVVNINVISNVEEEENKKIDNCNMSIYFTTSKDTLWGISKKFMTNQDIIMKNNNLSSEDIRPGMQLFIIK